MRHLRFALSLIVFLGGPAAGLIAQQPGPPPDAAGLGLKVTAVPEALYAHLPALEQGKGVLVRAIDPGSRAATLGLKTYDIVLAVGTTPVHNGQDLRARLVSLPPGEREVLQIVRGGKPFALTVATPKSVAATEGYMPPKSLFKPGGPPAVSVEIKPLAAGALEVNLFYLSTSNKMERRQLQGSLETIEHDVADLAQKGQMSDNVHDLVSLALKRLRTKAPK
jgi:C-terminal processing protease CtpA/Prc